MRSGRCFGARGAVHRAAGARGAMRAAPRRAATACLAVGVALGAGAAPPADGAGETALRFTASQSGTPLQGRFDRFDAQVQFDPRAPATGSVHARVELASVEAGSAEANALLRSAGFFDAGRFPQATFDAGEFVDRGAGHFVARGTFTLKGHTEALPVEFSATRDAHGMWFDGRFPVSRLAFGVGQGEWADTTTLDDTVVVQFHLRQPVGP